MPTAMTPMLSKYLSAHVLMWVLRIHHKHVLVSEQALEAT